MCVRLSQRRRTLIAVRGSALSGVVGPALFWTVLFVLGATQPAYDAVRSEISLLALGTNGWVQTANFAVFGLLIVAFQAGLLGAVAPGSPWGPINLLGLSIGLALISIAVFPTDATGIWTIHGEIHLGVVAALAALLPASCLAAAAKMRRDHRWHGYAGFSAVVGALTAACVLALLLVWIGAWRASHPWLGLYERTAFGLPSAWMEVVAIRLLRLS